MVAKATRRPSPSPTLADARKRAARASSSAAPGRDDWGAEIRDHAIDIADERHTPDRARSIIWDRRDEGFLRFPKGGRRPRRRATVLRNSNREASLWHQSAKRFSGWDWSYSFPSEYGGLPRRRSINSDRDAARTAGPPDPKQRFFGRPTDHGFALSLVRRRRYEWRH
jgi:hypothetical protein